MTLYYKGVWYMKSFYIFENMTMGIYKIPIFGAWFKKTLIFGKVAPPKMKNTQF